MAGKRLPPLIVKRKQSAMQGLIRIVMAIGINWWLVWLICGITYYHQLEMIIGMRPLILVHRNIRGNNCTIIFCLWCTFDYGVLLSMVHFCLWCTFVYGALWFMVHFCLWCTLVYGALLSMVHFGLWCTVV